MTRPVRVCYNGAMQNYSGIPLIQPRIENVVVYIVLVILAVIGLIILSVLTAKIIACLLLALFGLLHTFGYRRAANAKALLFYFALQTLLVTSLTWLASPSDAFTFLFFILGVQA